jgi:hypothetical protein
VNDDIPLVLKAHIDSITLDRTMHHIGLVFLTHFTSPRRAIFTAALTHFSAANISEWDDADGRGVKADQ